MYMPWTTIYLSVLSVSISGASRGTFPVRSGGWTSRELATTCENVLRAILDVGESSRRCGERSDSNEACAMEVEH